MPDTVASFRAAWREREPGPLYSGGAHLAFTSLGALAVVVGSLALLRAPGRLELAVAGAAFLVANLGEYLAHRFLMHRRVPGLTILHTRHTLGHHAFFTHEAMAVASRRDWKIVLFPPILLFVFLGALAGPLAGLAWVVLGRDAGLTFYAVAVSYFLLYEWLHLAYHLEASARVPVLAVLRRHHARHHDPAVMSRARFNITVPLADLVFGTLRDPG